MVNYDQIITKNALYWGQPEVTEILNNSPLQDILLNREVVAWLNDLYWGELLAAHFALLRYRNASSDRKTIWKKIAYDEMNHLSLVSKLLIGFDILPSGPSPLFRFLQSSLDELQFSQKNELLEMGKHYQLKLEQLIERLIDWRLPFIENSELKNVLARIKADETYHIHATKHEIERRLTPAPKFDFEHTLFPLHLARDLLDLKTFKNLRKIAPGICLNILGPQNPMEVFT